MKPVNRPPQTQLRSAYCVASDAVPCAHANYMTTRLLVPFVVLALGSAQAADLSDARIRELLIQQSIANYPGNCPCPHNDDRAGRRCGARSAYSKAAMPRCVTHRRFTKDMIAEFRVSVGNQG